MTDSIYKAKSTSLQSDEIYRGVVDAWCECDSNGYLVDWSETFLSLYPPIEHQISAGIHYRDFVRLLFSRSAIRNLHHIEDVNAWIENQLEVVGKESTSYNHWLLDGRWMMIRHTILSNGHWLFSLVDVTDVRSDASLDLDDEEKYREFASLSSDWFWELDDSLNYLFHSSHKQPLAGTSPEELIGRSRILELCGKVIDNDQLHMHNKLLRDHAFVDVTLSWIMNDYSFKHSKILAKPLHDKDGNFRGYLGCGRDVTSQFEMRQRLAHLANHDELTGLLNRRALAEQLDNLIIGWNQNPQPRARDVETETEATTHHSLIFIDLDRFKLINDDAGHQAGDQLLIELAEFLKRIVKKAVLIARLAGDEFAILVENNEQEAVIQSEEIIQSISAFSFNWKGRRFSVGASAGVVGLNDPIANSAELLSQGDIACYSAKLAGRNQVQLYSSQCSQLTQQNDEMLKLKMLKFAFNNEGLKLFLQPIVPTGKRIERTKYEVLLRVMDVDNKLISPSEVIPIAEKYDLMPQIDLWVIDTALQSIQQFHDMGDDIVLSVNLSGNTLSNQGTLRQIVELVKEYQLPKASLFFEITETAAIRELDQVCEFIEQMRSLGCGFSLDDFGSGLSSFKYLKSLKVDFLKIDGSFVKHICNDDASLAIVTSFNTLSHSMGMKTVAEFVENDEIAQLLTDLNVDYLQGYGVGKPRDINEWLNEHQEAQQAFGT